MAVKSIDVTEVTMKLLVCLISAISLCACQPVDREYPRGESGVSEATAPPMVVAYEKDPPSANPKNADPGFSDTTQTPVPDPPGETCTCVPLECDGVPAISAGPDGCTPRIGDDALLSVDIRMSAGETLSVYQGGELSMYLAPGFQPTQARATFSGIVAGVRFEESGTVLVQKEQVYNLPDDANTLLVDPGGDTTVIQLPVAMYNHNRIMRVKVVGNGVVDIKTDINGFTGIRDPLDGSLLGYSMQGVSGAPMATITLKAFYMDTPPMNPQIPHYTGWAIVGSYP